MRGLIGFWLLLTLLVGAGAGLLQYLGPPAALPARIAAATPIRPASLIPAAPDPTLREPQADNPTAFLPRIGPDGRRPMNVYAAPPGFPGGKIPPGSKVVALLISGLGMSQSESETAINALPAAVSLAFSPYAANPQPLIDAARAAGHEFLVSIPLEPAGFPLVDEGAQALLTGSTPGANFIRLEWALSRYDGYVGATSALDGMQGATFLRTDNQYADLQDQLNQRGLLFVEGRAGVAAPARVPGRSADAVIDAPPDAASIDAKLASLLAQAETHGSALGLAGPLRPVTLARLKIWIAALPSHGVKLVPVSALVTQTNAATESAP